MKSKEMTGGLERKLLSVPEVLAELGVPRSTFYKWRRLGIAPRCIKLPNGEVRIRRADLDAWLCQREDNAA
ncbi:putative DNA-binding transcriptional regulator AlpA [Catenuloplanes nepalensis]|uniref:DNA-binding transcriptional regulator AlpA n=1 Tax=Catenuloplanes nepalensis TaxID=587533 RepID=A0ABT9N4F7_9ACTN|nr:helix-turn-helix domain-containing protein [Catenuloplanes nepalensis]MDP9798597.1 putative DNA-binding transcriptional regulator AlpA [Catenuloplanes nepalensis]